MFYHFLFPLREQWFFFNLFKYITLRTVGASVTAFLVCVVLGPWITKLLSRLDARTHVSREHASQIHTFYAAKKTVPTMGGVLILLSLVSSNLLWGNLSSRYLWWPLGVVVWFGAIGFVDDWMKLKSASSRGLSGRIKFFGQLILGVVVGGCLYLDPEFSKNLYVPFFKNTVITLGIWFVPFVVLVLSGSSNALNLTDGLDGLAVGCLSFAAGAFSILSYIAGRSDFAFYLGMPHISGAGELTVFCASLVGASIGFLWYNAYPATIMMGDTGSLSLGGALGFVAIMIKNELTLLIVGGVFVWEACSVMIQVVSFRLFKRRVFLMSPFHHHLQLKGWPESKVTIRLWIVAFILALIGLGTIKLR